MPEAASALQDLLTAITRSDQVWADVCIKKAMLTDTQANTRIKYGLKIHSMCKPTCILCERCASNTLNMGSKNLSLLSQGHSE